MGASWDGVEEDEEAVVGGWGSNIVWRERWLLL